MHIHDHYTDGRWTEHIGQGVTEFATIVDALRSVNFRGPADIELSLPNNYVPNNPLLDFECATFGW